MGIFTEDAACNLRGDIVVFTLHEKSILREFTNIRKYSVNKWNCMHYPFTILFS